MTPSSRLLLVAFSIGTASALSAAACSSHSSGTSAGDGGTATEGGGKEGGATDGGAADAGSKDGGSTDGGASDGSPTDGGSTTDGEAGTSTAPVLGTLNTITTLGSTIDPVNDVAIDPTGSGDNPYGLAIAPVTAGLITAGDLVACNFNNGPNTVAGSPAPNTQGQGTTLVGLHPAPTGDASANPYPIAQSASLLGCSALSVFPDDSIAATAFSASLVPVVAPAGTVGSPFAADNLGQPWSSAYVAAANGQPAALYVSNAAGVIFRIALGANNAPTGLAQIASGFCVSGAVQGSTDSLHAPSGLTYDAKLDTLYVVDTSSYSVLAIAHVSSVAANGIVVSGGDCTAGPPTATPTFTGPSAASVKVIAGPSSANGGAELDAPLSAALLLNGNLIVGNADQDLTPNDAGTNQNIAFEISPTAGIVGTKQLDPGAPGALFGMAAKADGSGNQLVYFNDDNDNTVKVLSK